MADFKTLAKYPNGRFLRAAAGLFAFFLMLGGCSVLVDETRTGVSCADLRGHVVELKATWCQRKSDCEAGSGDASCEAANKARAAFWVLVEDLLDRCNVGPDDPRATGCPENR